MGNHNGLCLDLKSNASERELVIATCRPIGWTGQQWTPPTRT